MNIVRWNRYGAPAALWQAVDRLWEDSLIWPLAWAHNGNGVAALPLDAYHTDKELVIKAAIPGVKPEEVEVTVEGDCLTIKAERKAEEEVKGEHYVRREQHYGSFCRQVRLPEDVRAGEASASYENGVLTITLPKVEAAKPHQIKVAAKS